LGVRLLVEIAEFQEGIRREEGENTSAERKYLVFKKKTQGADPLRPCGAGTKKKGEERTEAD